jgi:hypothetical protein
LSQLLADAVVRGKLRRSRIYEVLQPGQQALVGVAAEPVVSFASAAALENAVSGGRLGPGIYGVLYDPEAWPFTPAAEQRDPVRAAAQAAAVAHAHGLRLIVTPGLNLTTVLDPGSRGPRWRQFLALNLAGQLARHADVIELQAQSLERDNGLYATFVRTATSQAGAANPRISVLAGLSANPPGAPVDSQNLTEAIDATRSTVAGYWLNIPGQGPRCPTCNPARPDIAIQTVRELRLPTRALVTEAVRTAHDTELVLANLLVLAEPRVRRNAVLRAQPHRPPHPRRPRRRDRPVPAACAMLAPNPNAASPPARRSERGPPPAKTAPWLRILALCGPFLLCPVVCHLVARAPAALTRLRTLAEAPAPGEGLSRLYPRTPNSLLNHEVDTGQLARPGHRETLRRARR